MITSTYTDVLEFFQRNKIKEQTEKLKKQKEKELNDYIKFLQSTTLCDI